MRLQESGEMYLETIFILTENNPHVRSIDVCEYMGFSKPSVSRAIGLLKNEGYILVDKDGYISLTDLGIEKSKSIFERHTVLTKMLISFGVNEETASEDACRMEHVISDETFNAMKNYLEKK